MHACLCVKLCACARVYVCVRACMCTRVCVFVFVCASVRAHMCVCPSGGVSVLKLASLYFACMSCCSVPGTPGARPPASRLAAGTAEVTRL